MLLIKTNTTFIKKNKKTKHGKKVYKQKKFITLQNGGITLQVKSIKITKMKKPIEKPVFDENTPGWNQGIQDFFKNNPPIPINNENVHPHYKIAKITGKPRLVKNDGVTTVMNNFFTKLFMDRLDKIAKNSWNDFF